MEAIEATKVAMEATEATLTTKLARLSITANRTKLILDAGQTEAIERHQAALKTVTAEVDHWRRAVEDQKIAVKQGAEEIDDCNTAIEAEVAKADKRVENLKKWLKDQKTKREIQDREEQLKFEVKLHED